MEYNHKFNIGSIMMDKMLDDYFAPRKTSAFCQKCPKKGQHWSCPEYAFDERLFLSEFKYLYLVGREFTIPKSDRQKTIGIQTCADYCRDVHRQMKLDSWKDMMAFEEAMPDVMTLMPGSCNICDLSGEGCTRPEKQICRHPELMRFSLEGLGFDVDSMCKFELGIMLQYQKEGRLPEKISTVIAICSNQKIPTAVMRHYFPEIKRSFLKAGDDRSMDEDRPKAKRVESWLESQAQAIMEQETDPNYKKKQHWIGFKDESLDSGDYVKNRTWADATFPEPAADSPWAEHPEEELREVEEEAPSYSRKREVSQPVFDPESGPLVGPSDEEDNSQYQWLGFKRDADDADELMYNRPIPKFSITPEEKAAQDAAIEREMARLKGEVVDEPEPEMTMTEAAELELKQEKEVPSWRKYEPKPIDYTGMSKKEIMAAEFERALYQKMSRMSDEEAEAFLCEQLGIPVPQQQAVPHVHGKRRLDPDASPEAQRAAALKAAQEAAEIAARPVPEPEPEPVPQPKAPEPEPEPITLLDPGDVDNVLMAALAIANHVTAPPEPEPEPVVQSEPEPQAAVNVSENTDSGEDGEDDSKYKWLGFKSKVTDDDGFKKGGWKKAY